MNFIQIIGCAAIWLASPPPSVLAQSQLPLTLERTIALAQTNDPWLHGNEYQQRSVLAQSIALASLPDPTVSLSVANLAVDSFNFAEEGMSQLKLGIAQKFPRGDSLAIMQQQLTRLSEQYPFQRQDRTAQLAQTVGTLWLDAYLAQQSLSLIQQNYALFAQLSDIVQSTYVSALGKTRQQDLVRAQLALIKLDEQIVTLNQQQLFYQQQLTQWLSGYQSDEADDIVAGAVEPMTLISLASRLPELELNQAQLVRSNAMISVAELAQHFTKHPAVKAVEAKINASKTGVTLAKQQYQPEWGVNASYAYRDNASNGMARADLLSVGVTFDLPIFTANKQDQQVSAAVSAVEVVKTERVLLLRRLMASFASHKQKLQQLNERDVLYQQHLLPQSQLQAEASLIAYTNDDGEFAEVVRAKIDELNAQIAALAVQVEIKKVQLALNYLTAN